MNRFQTALMVFGLLGLGAGLPHGLGGTPLCAQDEDPADKAGADVPEQLKALKDVARDRKGEKDAEGVDLINKLAAEYPKLDKKEQRDVAKGISDCFKATREPTQVRLLLAAGEALSTMGEDGAKVLGKVCDDKRYGKKEWLEFRGQLVTFLGRPAEDKFSKQLVDYAVRDKDDLIRAMAGGTLKHYAGKDAKVRKEIAEKLIKELSGIYGASKANADPKDYGRKAMEDRFAAIQDPWMKTLTALTGQEIKDPPSWNEWWNKNKNKDWDKEGFRTVPANDGAKEGDKEKDKDKTDEKKPD